MLSERSSTTNSEGQEEQEAGQEEQGQGQEQERAGAPAGGGAGIV